MVYSLELKTSSRRHSTLEVVKEKILSPQANQNPKIQDKRKVKNPFGHPYVDRHYELRQSAGVQLESFGNHQKQLFGSNTNKDDELVKHMSNLPGFLQRVERGENLQEKALNLGVLDWERLEKWKCNAKCIPATGNTKASASKINSSFKASEPSTLSSTTQNKTLAPQRKQHASHSAHLNLSHEESLSQGVQHSLGTVVQDFEKASRSTYAGQQNLHLKRNSSGRNFSEIKLDRGKKKESDQMTKDKKETSLSDWRKHGLPLSSHDTVSARCIEKNTASDPWEGETNTSVEEEFNRAHQYCLSEHQNIVLLLPKHSSRKSCSGSFQRSESRTSFDRKLNEANWKRFSDCFSPMGLDSIELDSEIPHSCPLPVSIAMNNESEMKRHREPSTSTKVETTKGLDEDIAEQPAVKGKHPSPNRRFSFSLARMTRSFSLKERSAVPHLSSTYARVNSGPVRSEASAGLDNFEPNKVNANRRVRSSPLKRLLDPLLKARGAHSAETVQPLNPASVKLIKTNELLLDKKHEPSTVQALVQLTIKNGLPIFKLVVDNSSEILVAAVKQLPTSDKDDSSFIYVFYSVHETKKKSGGRLNQGSKEKSCGFGYNIVGQMKVSSSHLRDLMGENSNAHDAVRESVLYSADIGMAEKETPDFVPNTELAAIVIKNQIEKNGDGAQGDKSNHNTPKGFKECLLEDTCNTLENEISNSTIVILPGGIHSLSNEGVPSPLINRWRSGGSCDCGGWDVGCKLQILTKQDQSSKSSRPSISCSNQDRLDLFVQGRVHENKPIFSLASFKNGPYSIEYNASISMLQAFSICVAVISSQKSLDIFEVNNLSEVKRFPEPITGSDTMKTPTIVQGKVPAKYVPSPPHSLVERV